MAAMPPRAGTPELSTPLGMPTIRELSAKDLGEAFAVVHQLRDHLDWAQFQQRATQQMTTMAYRLHGAFDSDGCLRAVLGMRPVTTLARGDHLHVDDLVVDVEVRGQGFGTALLLFAERWAESNRLEAVFLDSRQEVVTFYAELGYEAHQAKLMRKRIGIDARGRRGAL